MSEPAKQEQAKQEPAKQEPAKQEPKQQPDNSAEFQAMKELLSEMQEQNKNLMNEINEVKKTNAKLLLQFEPQEMNDGELFDIFDRHKRRN